MLVDLPPYAVWRFVDAVDGFEVCTPNEGGCAGTPRPSRTDGPTAVGYEITLDDRGRTREVRVSSDTVTGTRSTVLCLQR